MINKIIAKSKRSISNTIIILIGIVLFSFFIYLLEINFNPKNDFEEKTKIVGFIVLIVVILYCIYYLLNQKKISVYDNYFEIKNLFQTKRYYFSEIQTNFSESFEGKYNSWTEYYLILTSGKKLTFIDNEYSNFHDFFSKIKFKVKEDKDLNKKLSHPKFLKYAVICGIISCLMFYFSSFFYDFKPLENNDFSYITSELKNDMELIKERSGKRLRRKFKFELTNYPDFEFRISGWNYDVIPDDDLFLESFKKGNLITVGIKKDEYEKKISKTKELSFTDKFPPRYNNIQVYQVKNDKNVYQIDNKKINNLDKENNYWGIGFFSFVGLLSLYLSIGNYREYRNPKYNKLNT